MSISIDHALTTLVTGATGAQGGAVTRALLQQGRAVSVLVRDPASPAARALADAGARLVVGDLNDPASLRSALDGAYAAFSVQLYNPSDPAAEVRQAQGLIDAAKSAGVEVFIQSSVSGAGGHDAMPGWAEERWDRTYWLNKAALEEAVAAAEFASGVVLKPAFMMENFCAPKSAWMFPDLASGSILSAIKPETPVALVATRDIGAAAVAVLNAPDRFKGARIELAGDHLNVAEIAATLSTAWRRPIHVETLQPEAAVGRGQSPGWVTSQLWLNAVGYPARPEAMREFGLKPTSLAHWAAGQTPEGEP